MDKIDKVFSQPLIEIDDFNFDDKVAEVFPDMIKRSVPGYERIIRHLGTFAKLFVTDDSNVYDLGSSLGAATLSMRRHITASNVNMIAVDNSASMVVRSKKVFSAYGSKIPVDVVLDSIENINIQNASMVVLNFTLQFIDKETRTLL